MPIQTQQEIWQNQLIRWRRMLRSGNVTDCDFEQLEADIRRVQSKLTALRLQERQERLVGQND
jgi:outer membrane protein TolC